MIARPTGIDKGEIHRFLRRVFHPCDRRPDRERSGEAEGRLLGPRWRAPIEDRLAELGFALSSTVPLRSLTPDKTDGEAMPVTWRDGTLWLTRIAVRNGQFTPAFLTLDLPYTLLDLPAARTAVALDAGPEIVFDEAAREAAARVAAAVRTLERVLTPAFTPDSLREKVLTWAERHADASLAPLLAEHRCAIASRAKTAEGQADAVLARGTDARGAPLPAFRVTPATLYRSAIPAEPVGWLADYYGWTQDAETGQWQGAFLPLQTLAIARGIAEPGRLLHRSGVIAAPTSSGKTLLAELRMLARHFASDGRPSKTLMLVPSREIGVERAAHLRAAYGTTRRERRLRIVYSDGEHHFEDDAIRRGQFDVAVLVNEKLRAFSRTPGFLADIGEIVFDELETMGEEARGIYLEMAFTEAARYYPHLTVLGITRPADGLERLTATLGPESFLLETEKRPLPIDMGIWCPQTNAAVFQDCNTGAETHRTLLLGYPGNPCRTLRELLAEFVRQTEAEAEQGLRNNLVLAVPTKAETVRLAGLLGDLYDRDEEVRSWLDANANTDLLPGRLRALEPTFRRELLSRLLPRGIGFHHADLTREERRLVGQAFREGEIAVLVCTRTLAKGVNLPAQSIVFLGWGLSPGGSQSDAPPFYRALEGELVNWLGRVGRWGKQRHRPATALYLSLRPPGSDEYERIRRCLTEQRQSFRTALADTVSFREPVREAVAALTAAQGIPPCEDDVTAFLLSTPSAQEEAVKEHILRRTRTALARIGTAENGEQSDSDVVRITNESGRAALTLTPLGQAASEQGVSPETCRYFRDWLADWFPPAKEGPETSYPVWHVLDLLALVLLSPDGQRVALPRPPRVRWQAINAEFQDAADEAACELGEGWDARSVLRLVEAFRTDRMTALLALTRWRRGEPLYPNNGANRTDGFLETDYGIGESGGSLHALAREVSRLLYVLRGMTERMPAACFPLSRPAALPPLSEGIAAVPQDLETLCEELLFGVPAPALPLARLGVAGLSRSGIMALYGEVEASGTAPDLPLIERVKSLSEDEAAWAKILPTHGLRERVRERLAAYDRLPLSETLRADPEMVRRYYHHPLVQEAQWAQGQGRCVALRVAHRRHYTTVRRNSEPNVPLELRAAAEVDYWVENGAVEFLSEVGRARRKPDGGADERESYEVDAFHLDLLPRNGYPFPLVRQAAREVLRRLRAHDWTDAGRVLLLYDGAGGFHLTAPFARGVFRPVEAARRALETLAARVADDATIFLREQALREPYLLVDLSVNARRGIVRNAFSLNAVTGAVCVPVDPAPLAEFDPAEAMPERALAFLDGLATGEAHSFLTFPFPFPNTI